MVPLYRPIYYSSVGAEMNIEDRVARERAAHDEDDVLGRAYALKARFAHTMATPAIQQMEREIAGDLGDVEGLSVLDFGCGRGEMSLRLLHSGARVVGIDISKTYVDIARSEATAAGHDPGLFEFLVMDAHILEFEDNCFDLVIGRGILHHLDYETALAEVRRVLRPGGRAVFLEPLGSNPLLRVFRALTPKARTKDERPFYRRDIRKFSHLWEDHSRYYGLFCAPTSLITSIIMRHQPDNFFLRSAWRLEQFFHNKGWLNYWNQYVLFRLEKPDNLS